jgi:preprotein translocase subunit SecD
VAAGQIAAFVGLALVMIYMIVSYGLFGLLADIALLVNVVLILGALSAIQATLTLPGIAGIVLTMGMAVDANVLVFERIREELRRGRNVMAAIEGGYKRAISTIVDANLTTLFAALFLYIFGSGPIKGFAVTLSIGIATSLFTAVMVTRLLVILWLERRRPRELVL